MRKFISLGICVLMFSVSAIAQNRDRVFDNFDTSRRITVVNSTVKPIAESKQTKTSKGKQEKMSVNEGIGLNKVKKTASSRLTMGSADSLGGFTTGDSEIDSYIVDSSKRYNIDPRLIYAQMHQESAFKLKARSHKGASGLMQLMPATARRFGVTNIYDPQQNIDAGVKYMRWLLNKFGGNVVLALAGYNAGEGAVMKYGNNIPPYRETQEYVRRITFRYNNISDPGYERNTKPISKQEVAKIEKKESVPLTTFELNITAVKLPDGRMRLVSQ